MSKIEAGMKVFVKSADESAADLEAKVVSDPKGGWVMIKFKDKALGEKKVRVGTVSAPPPKAARAAKVLAEGETDGRLVPADLSHYVAHETKTSSGRKHLDINDATAEKLREKTLDQVYTFAAKALDEPEKELRARYANLNVGMQRMNLGNRIRGAFKAAESASAGLKEMKKAA